MHLKQSADVNQQYTGTIVSLKKIINDEGLLGLYKGATSILFTKFRGRSKNDSVCTQCGFSFYV